MSAATTSWRRRLGAIGKAYVPCRSALIDHNATMFSMKEAGALTALAPLIFSLKTLAAPASIGWACCSASVWLSVLTLVDPTASDYPRATRFDP
jgi:hypothetical protein